MSLPALERAREGALLRKAGQEGDLREAVVRVAKEAPRKISARGVHNILKGMPQL